MREVAAGGSVLDPKIVEGLTTPVRKDATLTAVEEDLLQQVAEGRTIKAIAGHLKTTPAAADAAGLTVPLEAMLASTSVEKPVSVSPMLLLRACR